jgi:hypothetical protein
MRDPDWPQGPVVASLRAEAQTASARIMVSVRSVIPTTFRTLAQPFRGPDGRYWAFAVPLLALLSFFYLFMASAGTFASLHGGQTNFYDRLAEGFRHGHLYIDELPSPALLAQPDPYDDACFFKNLWLWDAALYRGHYYVYWGPVPALLILLFKITTRYQGEVTDQWPTLLFMLGRLYAGTALIVGLARDVRLRLPVWLTSLAILVFGLASPTPFIVARPHVYEAGLAAGQCFLMCGLLAAFHGLVRPSRRITMFVVAGACWTLGFGSRVTMLIPIPLIIAATVLIVWARLDRSFKALWRNTLALSGVPAIGLFAHGLYNYLRFDAFTETGIAFQVTLQRYSFHSVFVVPNLVSYLFAQVKWSCEFPFVTSLKHRALFEWMQWPDGYLTFERVAGILVTASWCWLIVVAAYRPLEYLWRRWRAPHAVAHAAGSTLELWALLCSCAVLPAMIPALGLWEASMRYPGDVLSGILVICTLAAGWLLRRTEAARDMPTSASVRVLLIAMAVHTCFVGTFSGVASYEDPLKTINPTLFQTLSRALSVCSKQP